MNRDKLSLRERKKLATRNALIASSRRLFIEKGYEDTTLAEICNEVQIHVTTFFAYFDSKEELALARTVQHLDDLVEKLSSRPATVSVIDFWWSYLSEYSVSEVIEEEIFVMNIDTIPSLLGRFQLIVQKFEDVIAAAISRDAGRDPANDLYARMQASVLLLAGITAARWYWRAIGETRGGLEIYDAAKSVINHFPSREQFERDTNIAAR